jgi:starch-binding outer membrane protein, SusD/RagB family
MIFSSIIISGIKHLIRHKYSYLFLLSLSLTTTGCKKFVELKPPVTSLVGASVFANNSSANAAVANIYIDMISNSTGMSSGTSSISLHLGLYADEFAYFPGVTVNGELAQFYSNKLSGELYYYWIEIFKLIYEANNVIEKLEKSTGVSADVKKQLTGEAKFLRALVYFYAVNLYGELPLVTTTDYQVNNTITRSSTSAIFDQIIKDLKDAETVLSKTYASTTLPTNTERTRANANCASALLARVYLYMKDWQNAELKSSLIIDNPLYSLDTLPDVFTKNSKESILQLEPVFTIFNTFDAYYFVLTTPPGSSPCPVALNQTLVNAFEPGDLRRNEWIGMYTDASVTPNVDYYYPHKYEVSEPFSPLTEYLMVLRLGEQYLIRAEARAQQNNLTGSAEDLNMIRKRSGLSDADASDQSGLLDEIFHERQVELFTEWGHRWFDLKRRDNFNTLMTGITTQKGTTWNPDFQLLPVPYAEIQRNNKLTQNKSY